MVPTVGLLRLLTRAYLVRGFYRGLCTCSQDSFTGWLASRRSGSLSKARNDLGVPSPKVLLPVQVLPTRKQGLPFVE